MPALFSAKYINIKHLYVKGYIILALKFSFNSCYNNSNCKKVHSIAGFGPRLQQSH